MPADPQLAALPAEARVRILAADPPLAPAAGMALREAFDRLLAQFVREGRCARAATGIEGGGCFVVIAWEGPELSGCSHDKLSQVAAQHETRSGSRLLDAPPIALGEPPRLVDRAGLRALAAAGGCAADTPWWDLRSETLGAWRAGPRPLASSPFAHAAGCAP